MSYLEVQEEVRRKVANMSCPDCETDGQLEYADDETLVCKLCGYSIEAEDLEDEWLEKIAADHCLGEDMFED